MQKPRHFYGKHYKSGDALVDWIFRRFIESINTKIKQIVLKRRLKYETEELLDGLWEPNTHTLYLNPAKYKHKKSYDILQSFIHELGHILFESIRERNINQLENILFEKLTPQQKRALRSFIPKDETDS
ncbi:MAG: hypothetical protein UW15_C0015G0006 [Parcubacteria group bacterium GW2011_GWC1_44_10]|nr:MAG: hypothetical protein UW15_C0015G0006 [Parcubacteria group bacterium GW2011_GWC1_44_10]KKT57050.1 MAG: hypothetical protein UW49_C0008G0012 [Candidatus Giovannonibacteria bacterium GW2011_GWB1_44_23]KKT59487.1 MAG: hypothetical protein UW53_C0011G0016 [Candidatus Giovannonibacteria bacterium GW2011_GWA1_44_25]